MTPHIADLHHAEMQVRLETAAALLAERAYEPLVTALAHADNEVRWRAAALLGWLGDPRAIPALLATLPDGSYEVKFNAVWALGQIAAETVFEPLTGLVDAAGDHDPDVRYVGALALLRLGQVETVRRILAARQQDFAYQLAHGALASYPYL
jgi:HEAT repeat protein